ncbi:MFS transporter [Micromonospora sp. NPDC049559]|uniref:MFS transporter n=1 Tax=Micromonospora sp. NPDC049559 TaxID=3155923 RepID=UPI00342B2367
MPTAPRATRLSLLVLAYLAFVSLGLPDGLLGVGWPSIRSEFRVPTEAVGLLLTAGTAGYLTSSIAAGFSIARLGVGLLLAGSTGLASLALAGYAVSPVLAVTVGCALLLGLGSGAIDSGLNAYAATMFGPRHMNWMHAFFGLGVAIGPLIMTSVLGSGLSWRWGYGIVSAAQLLLALAFVLNARTWDDRRGSASGADQRSGASGADQRGGASGADQRGGASGADQRGGASGADRPAAEGTGHGGPVPAPTIPVGPVPVRDTLRLPAVWLGIAAFAVYVAIEVASGLWAFLLLTDGRGLSATVAGVCVSGYWGSLFAGRVVQGIVAERLGPARVLRWSLVGMAFGALLVAVPAPAWLAVAGLAIIGFGAAPVFPLLTLGTADRVGTAHADRTIGLQIGAAGLGGALVPTTIGFVLDRFGVGALGPALLILSLLLIALHAATARRPSVARD